MELEDESDAAIAKRRQRFIVQAVRARAVDHDGAARRPIERPDQM
jgi:hypothetical protein